MKNTHRQREKPKNKTASIVNNLNTIEEEELKLD